jgi:tetratricopeptide (TPR) repeat protein
MPLTSLLQNHVPRSASWWIRFSGRIAMKKTSVLCPLAVFIVLLVFLPTTTAAQTPATGQVKGTVTDSSKPLAGAVVNLANVSAGKSFKIKTDDFGRFAIEAAPYGDYEVEVISAGGERLLTEEITINASGSPAVAIVKIDVSQSKITSIPSNPTPINTIDQTAPAPKTKYTKQQIRDMKTKNEKTSEMNVLILQANAALLEGHWQEALAPLQELTGMDPDNWEYFSGLGDAQSHLGQYQEAIGSYEAGILVAGDTTAADPNHAGAELERKKEGVGHMLNNEGNTYSELHKTKEALAAYSKAAALDPNPKLAYYNLCAAQYNAKNVEGALAACDKATAVDPGKAETYFLKGSLLVYMNQPGQNGKVTVPAGAADALKKYLELAPDGEHAREVRQMLEYLATIKTLAENADKTKKN